MQYLPQIELKCIKTCIWRNKTYFKEGYKYKIVPSCAFSNPIFIDEYGNHFGFTTESSGLGSYYDGLVLEHFFDVARLQTLLVFA